MATSDEQRAAFEAHMAGLYPQYVGTGLSWDIAFPNMWAGWQACAAQQAPQERADEQPWKQLVEDCAKYLKEGETPRQRMDRDFAEMQTVLKVWGETKQRAEQRISSLESERLAGAAVYEGGYRCRKCGEVVEMKLHSVNFAQQQTQQHAALAANPQQSNGAVEKPTKEPDAAIGASQVPEGVANAERSAMQLCPTPNPQQVASETKEQE